MFHTRIHVPECTRRSPIYIAGGLGCCISSVSTSQSILEFLGKVRPGQNWELHEKRSPPSRCQAAVGSLQRCHGWCGTCAGGGALVARRPTQRGSQKSNGFFSWIYFLT